MVKFEVIGDGGPAPWWRSVLWVLLGAVASLVSLVFSPEGAATGPEMDSNGPMVLVILGFGVGITLLVGLFWRHRVPFLLALGSAVASMLLSIGNAIPLLALAALIGRRKGPAVWWTAAFTAFTSSAVVIADATENPRAASVQKSLFAAVDAAPTDVVPGSPLVAVLSIVIGLAVAVGGGLLMRSQRETRSARVTAAEERATSDRLGDEVARRQERERIAREVHDAMGHRLSLLNLHAGALEANSTDPRVAESAHLVRTSATAAMDDLRSLLAVLRDPMAFENANVPLSKLPEVVRESFGAGQSLSSSIYIADPERADPALSRGVYRIVQELLTNARRHAPGEQLFLTVEGSPGRGIVIDARNRYVGGRTSEAGGSRGLTGITERAELLGGQMTYGLDDGGQTFRVHVELPWREA
ncbi:histidine kinase [Ammonicoccus fulvus]|uniref:histidine kinase n=1 Tax=Ammonicoccus fulvus TaxID=3138240 RepID=A0ABZ3FWE8_9ACTN